ncbi:hypothetical protein ACW7N6_33910 [Streptomyces sp. UC1A3]
MISSRSRTKKNAAGIGASPQSRRRASQSIFSRRVRAIGSTAPKSQWCSEKAASRPRSRSVGASTGMSTESTDSSSALASSSVVTGSWASSKIRSTCWPRQLALSSQSSGGVYTVRPASRSVSATAAASSGRMQKSTSCWRFWWPPCA